jgi:hypothetical protein
MNKETDLGQEIISKLKEITAKVDNLLSAQSAQIKEVNCHGYERAIALSN